MRSISRGFGFVEDTDWQRHCGFPSQTIRAKTFQSFTDSDGVESTAPSFEPALIAAYRHAGMESAAKQYEDYKPRHGGEVLASGDMLTLQDHSCVTENMDVVLN